MGKTLITGIAGFIGSQVAKHFLAQGKEIVGLDNLNEVTDPFMKWERLKMLDLPVDQVGKNQPVHNNGLVFYKADLNDEASMKKLFADHQFDTVIHLAANTGVRNSIDHPQHYLQANVLGFEVLLRCCRDAEVGNVIFASSSSVYGKSKQTPFHEDDDTSYPLSPYAISKKTDELLAHTYSYLYGLSIIGLRFFTVYGPWTRSDMAAYLFMDAIQNGRPIKMYNKGEMYRDFTYVEDVVKVIELIVAQQKLNNNEHDKGHYRVMNVGHQHPVQLTEFVRLLANHMGEKARTENYPLQAGDMPITSADTNKLKTYIGFVPDTDLQSGIAATVAWFQTFTEGVAT